MKAVTGSVGEAGGESHYSCGSEYRRCAARASVPRSRFGRSEMKA